MPEILELGDVSVEVVLKDIKNIHLSVYPPTGRVRIAAPSRTSLETIRLFAISKLGWIKKQQQKLKNQKREQPREYVERESHYVWGKRYLLSVVEHDAPSVVELQTKKLILKVRHGADLATRRHVMEQWYRKQLKVAAQELIQKWEKVLQVKSKGLFVRRMKTKWGSCNPQKQTIRLNTDLARKPPECLEYVVVHELAHLIERSHNERFTAILDNALPNWEQTRDHLNQSPLPYENWQ